MYPAYTTNTDDILYNPMARYNQESNLVYQGSETSLKISEKSYPPLFTSEEIAKYAILLYYSLKWHFYTLLATNIMCFFVSYELFFDPSIQEHIFTILVKSICNVFLISDSLITIYQYWNRVAVHKMTYEYISTGLVITQSTTLLVFILLGFKVFYQESVILNSILLVLYILRYYKLGLYVRLMHRVPGEMLLRNIFGKNLLILSILVHTLVCIWINLGCLEESEICDKKYKGPGSYWNDGVHIYLSSLSGKLNRSEIHNFSPIQNYLICLYYIMGGLTHVGYGGSSLRNYPEDIVLIITMFLSMFMIVGLKGAEQSNFVIHGKTLEYEMLKRRQAMSEELRATKYLKRDHRKTMLKYYEDFWQIDKAVKISSMLQIIPRSLFNDTQLEIFWIFLNKCYFLRHTTESFKRALAATIKIEVLNKGFVLYEHSGICENVYYIARGNIDILSGEDGSSSLITLGKGSCLGQLHLLQRTLTRFKVVIASYSVVYILNKRYFWENVYKFRKLYQGPKIHSNYKAKIKIAVIKKNAKKQTDVGAMFRRWRCIVSKKILTGFKEHIKSYVESNELGVRTYEDPQKLYIYSKMHSQKTYDEIFLNTSFPYILQHNSSFLKVWNAITIAVVIFVAIVYPYKVAFQAEFQVIAEHVVAGIYILDIIIQLFTSIDNKLDVIRKVEEIVANRLENPKFTLDIFAAIPLYLIGRLSKLEGTSERICHILCLIKLLKLYRVDEIFKELERNTQSNIILLSSVRNVLFLSYIGYLSGCIYYIATCFQA